jgi:hypothetical protein
VKLTVPTAVAFNRDEDDIGVFLRVPVQHRHTCPACGEEYRCAGEECVGVEAIYGKKCYAIAEAAHSVEAAA